MKTSATFVAAGDMFMTRRLPENGYKGFDELVAFLKSFDVRFANLEFTVHDREGYPGAFSGGTWSMTHPSILEDIEKFGFNLYNAANNHSMDYSHNGLEATMRYLEARNMRYAGVGRNLADASAPVYIDCNNSRVALVAATASFHDFWMAGEQRRDMQGRPGVNGLRFTEDFHVEKKYMDALKEMADPIQINAARNQTVKEGFGSNDDGVFMFGKHRFIEDEKTFRKTTPNKADMARIVASIQEARRQADYVLVSIHCHAMNNADKEQPAEFLETFSRSCIDAGAIAVLGHGPHILRGMELYHNGVIFYSLGDFLFENDTTTHQPSDFYTQYKLPHDAAVGMGMDTRSKNGTIGLDTDYRVWESLVPCFTVENDKITEIKLVPIDLSFNLPRYRKGLPVISQNKSVIDRFAKMSEPYGTEIDFVDGVGIVKIP